jgi:hypothetical protein
MTDPLTDLAHQLFRLTGGAPLSPWSFDLPSDASPQAVEWARELEIRARAEMERLRQAWLALNTVRRDP